MKKKTEQEIKKELEDFSSAVQAFREARRNALLGVNSDEDQSDEAGDQSGEDDSIKEQ